MLTCSLFRPSSAIISAIQNEKRAFETILLKLKSSTPDERARILDQLSIFNGAINIQEVQLSAADINQQNPIAWPETPRPSIPLSNNVAATSRETVPDIEDPDFHDSDVEFDASRYLSVDDQGQVSVFGLTSTLHNPGTHSPPSRPPRDEARYQLIANAAIERQKEFSVRLLPDIDGVPINLAMHLLDLHWNRQHHTFLLTYRPAFMRGLVHGGPYYSKLLLNAIFACASKYSDRVELRDDHANPLTAGGRFFRRCDQILAENPPWGRSSISTVVAFLLLGSTFISRGEISKGWSYSGFAMRMAFDLGLHLDCRKPGSTAEDIEIRKRVYWGAFICDKVQSLYLGRPPAMQWRDCHISHDLMDTMEELDIWMPYIDPEYPDASQALYHATPVHSVSTFEQLCELSKLMAAVINRLHSSSTTPAKAQATLRSLDESLQKWYEQIPEAIYSDSFAKRCIGQFTNAPTKSRANFCLSALLKFLKSKVFKFSYFINKKLIENN